MKRKSIANFSAPRSERQLFFGLLADNKGAFWANVMQQKFEEVKGGSEYLVKCRPIIL